MSETVKKIKIKDLESKSTINDEDVFIIDDSSETYKISANEIAEYINGKSDSEENIQSDWEETDTSSDAYIKNKPTSLPADGGDAETVNGHTVNSDVPANAKFTDTTYEIANSTTAGIIKSGTDITVDSEGNVSVNDNSHNHIVKDISDLTATASELNVLAGITATTTELNYTNGVTSNIQSQLDAKAPIKSPTFTGTPTVPTATVGTSTTQIATTAFVQTGISNHNTSTTAHSDIRDLISELTTRLNTLADSDDTTLDQLSEIVSYIKDNRDLIEGITTDKTNVADIIDNLTSTATDKPLSANQGRVLNELIDALNGSKINTITGDSYIDASTVGTAVSISHNDISRVNTTSTASPAHGGAFTTVKSVTSDLKGHITGVNTETVTLPTYSVVTQSSNGLASASDKIKLDGIETGAEVNQNAFSSVTVGDSTISANTETDTLTFKSGSNVSIVLDTENKRISIDTDDTANNTVTYSSNDSDESTEWSDTDIMVSGEKHSSILNKISTMFKNVRYLYNMFSTLNTNLTANDIPFRFGCTEDGEYGYIIEQDGADTVIPFKTDSSYNLVGTELTADSSGETDEGGYEITYTIPSNSEALMCAMAGIASSSDSTPTLTVLINGSDVTSAFDTKFENNIVAYYDTSYECTILMFYVKRQDLESIGVYNQEFTLSLKYENVSKYDSHVDFFANKGSDDEETYNLVISDSELTADSSGETDEGGYEITYTIPADTEAVWTKMEYMHIYHATSFSILINGENVSDNDFSGFNSNNFDEKAFEGCGQFIDITLYSDFMFCFYLTKQDLENIGVYGEEFTLTLKFNPVGTEDIMSEYQSNVYLLTKELTELEFPTLPVTSTEQAFKTKVTALNFICNGMKWKKLKFSGTLKGRNYSSSYTGGYVRAYLYYYSKSAGAWHYYYLAEITDIASTSYVTTTFTDVEVDLNTLDDIDLSYPAYIYGSYNVDSGSSMTTAGYIYLQISAISAYI